MHSHGSELPQPDEPPGQNRALVLLVALVAAGAILAAGCGGSERQPVVGSKWIVETVNGQATQGSPQPWVQFGAEKVQGWTGCNPLRRAWSWDSETLIQFETGDRRAIGCAPEVEAQDEIIARIFSGPATVQSQAGGILVLSGDGDQLTLVADASPSPSTGGT